MTDERSHAHYDRDLARLHDRHFGMVAEAAARELDALAERLRTIHAALVPGGLLLFDVAGPGRSGPTGSRSVVGP